MYSLIILIVLLSTAFSAPLSSCSSQIQCLNLDITEQTERDPQGNKQYELCLYWSADLPECRKDDKISHACPLNGDDKIEGWEEGLSNAMCDVVSCDSRADFAIKDGGKCNEGQVLGDFSINNYTKLVRCYDGEGGDCSAKNSKACRWLIPAPDCRDETTTTTTTTTTLEPGVTTDPTATTTTTTTTTTTDPPCACTAVPYNECSVTQDCAPNTLTQCVCHRCDCGVIDAMAFIEGVSWDDVIDRCMNDCFNNCVMFQNEMCVPIEEGFATMYSRDSETGYNTNPDFVVVEDADVISVVARGLQKKVVATIVIAVTIAIVAVILLAIFSVFLCSKWRARQNKKRFDSKVEEEEEEVADESDHDEDVEQAQDGVSFTVNPYQHNK